MWRIGLYQGDISKGKWKAWDRRLTRVANREQGPFTGSDFTGVSLGLGTHKRMYPFIFTIKITQ